MSRDVHGWEVRKRPDGSYGVYDNHGMVEGPFGKKEAAIAAALAFPMRGQGLSGHGHHAFARRPPRITKG